MKTLISMLILAASFSASANVGQGVERITCDNNSNSDLQMEIVVEQESKRVLGASLYNVDWSQTADATYQDVIAVGAPNPVAGIEVVLKDGQTLDIDYFVLDKAHNGSVTLNGTDTYHCY